MRRYTALLRSTARGVLRSDADVDEAVQRTWVLLLRNADRIDDPRCLPGWLATTARREALAVLRSQQRAVPSEDVADRVAPDDRDLGTGLMSLELRRELHRAVDTLPETQRRIVWALLREPAVLRRAQPGAGHPAGQPRPAARPGGAGPRAQLEPEPALRARSSVLAAASAR